MKQLNFRHFNTRSKNFTVTVIFSQNKTKTAPKRPIRHLHISQNAPCLPPTILHKHCFQFLSGQLYYQGEMKTNGYIFFFFFFVREGGGGGTRCIIMGDVQMANITLFSISRSFRPFYADNPDYFRGFSKITEDCRRCPKNPPNT